MDIRPATPEDIPAIQEVDRSLEQRVSDDGVLRHAIADGRLSVALVDGEAAGYVRWEWFWDRIPYCVFARVRPAHHRNGIGRALYAFVEEGLRERGCEFWLSSTEEDNDGSMRFHKALEFRLIGLLSDLGQDSREVFMRKDLT